MKYSLLKVLRVQSIPTCQGTLVKEANKLREGVSQRNKSVATVIDRQGNLIMELACKGRITSNELETLYEWQQSKYYF